MHCGERYNVNRKKSIIIIYKNQWYDCWNEKIDHKMRRDCKFGVFFRHLGAIWFFIP